MKLKKRDYWMSQMYSNRIPRSVTKDCKTLKDIYKVIEKAETSPKKYKNIKTEIDGIKFDSQKEANRYCELKILEKKAFAHPLN